MFYVILLLALLFFVLCLLSLFLVLPYILRVFLFLLLCLGSVYVLGGSGSQHQRLGCGWAGW